MLLVASFYSCCGIVQIRLWLESPQWLPTV